VYVPAAREDAVAVVAPLLQLYVYPGFPPDGEAFAVPEAAPLQRALVKVMVDVIAFA
jgi:hypothetical protein